jgi:hypothetical protein
VLPVTYFKMMPFQAGYYILIELPLQDMTMIKVEKSDPFSSESHRLIEMLSAELAAITGDSGKTNFTVEAMNNDTAVWALAKNAHGDAIGCGAIRPLTQNIAELKGCFQIEVSQEWVMHYLLFWKALQSKWDIEN